ncbi:MAG: glycerate kinase [Bacteroidales bacterium]|nr:glycerate kinase [Bacteroidales bacterium]
MKFVLAIDSFKNCMTSAEANNAAAEGVRDVYPDATILQMPVSDDDKGRCSLVGVCGNDKRLIE